MAAFKNKGWRFYDGVRNIFPVGPDGVSGAGAYMVPPSSSWGGTEEDGDNEEYDHNAVSRPQPSSQSRRSTGSRPVPTQVPELPDLNHRFTLEELADAVEMYEDVVVPPPASSSVSSWTRKRDISQVSPSEQFLPGPRARSRLTPSSHGAHSVQQQRESTSNSLHSSVQQSVASSSRPSKRTQANPGSGSGQMAVISGLSSALQRIADVVSDAQPSVDKPMSPLLSAANIGPTDAIPLLNSDHTLSADARAYLADLFMEKSDVLRVYVLLDAEARHRFAEMQYAKGRLKDTSPPAPPGPLPTSRSSHVVPPPQSSSYIQPPANSKSFTFGDLTTDFTTASFDDPSSSSVFMPPFSEPSLENYAYAAPPGYAHTASSSTYAHPSSDALSTQEVLPTTSDTYMSLSASTMYTIPNIPDGEQGGDVSGSYNVYTNQDDVFEYSG